MGHHSNSSSAPPCSQSLSTRAVPPTSRHQTTSNLCHEALFHAKTMGYKVAALAAEFDVRACTGGGVGFIAPHPNCTHATLA